MTTIRLNGVTVMTDALVLADAGALPGSSGLSALGMSPDAVSPGLTIGANGKPVSAALDMQSIQGALLLPRLPTSAYTNSSFTPYNGMILYDTNLNTYLSYGSGSWSPFGSGSGGVSYSAGGVPAGAKEIPVFVDNTGTTITGSGVNITTITSSALLNNEINKNIKAPSITHYQIGTTIGSSSALDSIVFGGNEGPTGVGGLYIGSLLAQEFLENGSAITTLITDGIPGTTTTVSAALEIQSSSRGVLLPRLSSTHITNPANGLLYYDTVLSNFCGYVGGSSTPSQIVTTSSANPFNPPSVAGTNGYFLQLSNATTGATQWSSAVTSVAAGTNLTGGTITGTGTIALSSTPSGLTSLGVGNLSILGNTISATNPNGSIILTPNGTGNVSTGNLSLSGNSITTNAVGFSVYDKFGMGFNSISSSLTSIQLDMWCPTYKNNAGSPVGQDWMRWQYDGSSQPISGITNPAFRTYFFSNVQIDSSCSLLVNNVSTYSGADISFNKNINILQNNNLNMLLNDNVSINSIVFNRADGKGYQITYEANNGSTNDEQLVFFKQASSSLTTALMWLNQSDNTLNVNVLANFSGSQTYSWSNSDRGVYGQSDYGIVSTGSHSFSISLNTNKSIVAANFIAASTKKNKLIHDKGQSIYEEVINKIKDIEVFKYTFRKVYENNDFRYGFVAEDVHKSHPHLIHCMNDGLVNNLHILANTKELQEFKPTQVISSQFKHFYELHLDKPVSVQIEGHRLKIEGPSFNDDVLIIDDFSTLNDKNLIKIASKNTLPNRVVLIGTYEETKGVDKLALLEMGFVAVKYLIGENNLVKEKIKNALKRIEILEDKLKIEKH